MRSVQRRHVLVQIIVHYGVDIDTGRHLVAGYAHLGESCFILCLKNFAQFLKEFNSFGIVLLRYCGSSIVRPGSKRADRTYPNEQQR